MGVILQVALPSRVLAAARLQCGAAGAGASRGLGVCAEHARLAARGESARAMEIGDFLVWLGPVANSQCAGVNTKMNTNIGPQTPPPRARVVRYVYEAGRPRVPVRKSRKG